MKVNELYIIRHLRDTYGGVVSYKGDNLFVRVGSNKIQINLAGRRLLGYYVLSYQGMDSLNEESCCVRLTKEGLGRALFLAWSYAFYQENGIFATEEDWERFVKDAHKYAKGGKV